MTPRLGEGKLSATDTRMGGIHRHLLGCQKKERKKKKNPPSLDGVVSESLITHMCLEPLTAHPMGILSLGAKILQEGRRSVCIAAKRTATVTVLGVMLGGWTLDA